MALVPLVPLDLAGRGAADLGRSAPTTAVLALGPLTALAAVVVALATGSTAWSTTVPAWTVWAAVVSLALGIPHGAVDGRTLAGRPRRRRTARLYLLLAASSAALVLVAPVPAFLGIVALSVWHFGTGDVESRVELAGDDAPQPGWRVVHALAFGAAPVVLPLTAAATAATFDAVQPHLGALVGEWPATAVRVVTLAVVAISAAQLARTRRSSAVVELVVLVALASIVTPLLAFAVYFAFWHALRHTARLGLEGGRPLTAHALVDVARSGLPALAASALGVAALVAVLRGLGTPPAVGTVLWLALALVWGLTVPHMLVVGEFDRRRRRARQVADRRSTGRRREAARTPARSAPAPASPAGR